MRRLGGASVAAAVLFGGVYLLVLAGWNEGFDRVAARLVQATLRSTLMTEAARDLTGLGSNLVLGLVAAIGAGYGALTRRRMDAAGLLVAASGCLVLVGAVKSVVGRARPELVTGGPLVFTTSFPSSHAALSAAMAVVIAGLLLRGELSRAAQRFVGAVAAGLPLLIGLSRVYLGLHWPSDVLAGWALGGGWGCACLAGLAMRSGTGCRGRGGSPG